MKDYAYTRSGRIEELFVAGFSPRGNDGRGWIGCGGGRIYTVYMPGLRWNHTNFLRIRGAS